MSCALRRSAERRAGLIDGSPPRGGRAGPPRRTRAMPPVRARLPLLRRPRGGTRRPADGVPGTRDDASRISSIAWNILGAPSINLWAWTSPRSTASVSSSAPSRMAVSTALVVKPLPSSGTALAGGSRSSRRPGMETSTASLSSTIRAVYPCTRSWSQVAGPPGVVVERLHEALNTHSHSLARSVDILERDGPFLFRLRPRRCERGHLGTRRRARR